METVELGDKVKCKLTGFTGIVNGVSQWLTGCDKVSIQAPMKKDGSFGDSYWVDRGAVQILKKRAIKKSDVATGKDKGGPAQKSNLQSSGAR